MDVTGKNLLNSAENIIKNRTQRRTTTATEQNLSTPVRTEQALKSQSAPILQLESGLQKLQKDFSYQQARFSFLENEPQSINAELKFGQDPLFPEFPFEINLQEFKANVQGQVTGLSNEIQQLQLQLENHYALNFDSPPPMLSAESLTETGNLGQLDPERVARLTR